MGMQAEASGVREIATQAACNPLASRRFCGHLHRQSRLRTALGSRSPFQQVGKVFALPAALILWSGSLRRMSRALGPKGRRTVLNGFLPPRSQDRDGQAIAGAHRSRPSGEARAKPEFHTLPARAWAKSPGARVARPVGFSNSPGGGRGLQRTTMFGRTDRAREKCVGE